MNGTTLTFTYDQFGRMTKKTGGGKTADYYYHYGDKLTKVASNFGGEGTVTYTVGGDQKRRSRAVSGGDTIKYRYDKGWSVLNEESGAGTLEATYVHSSSGGSATPGKQIGTVLATSAGTTASTGTWAYYFQDAIGSTRGLWDEEADRIGKYDYPPPADRWHPFGGKYSDSGEDITRKFTGHDWDSASRLYYTAYRYYSPDSNRWLTRDPLGMVDGPNVYAYVKGNPVSLWDNLGLCGAADPEGETWLESCYETIRNSLRSIASEIERGKADYLVNRIGGSRADLQAKVLEISVNITAFMYNSWGYSPGPGKIAINPSMCGLASRTALPCLVAHEVYHAMSPDLNRFWYVMGLWFGDVGIGCVTTGWGSGVASEEYQARKFATNILGCTRYDSGL